MAHNAYFKLNLKGSVNIISKFDPRKINLQRFPVRVYSQIKRVHHAECSQAAL